MSDFPKTLMIQATGSDAGKSLIVAGLCRLFSNKGLKVRPFKPQNMSNNAAVTADGGEIGRAQALQALACRVETTVDMNPVLLKPQSEVGAQLIVQGKMVQNFKARDYAAIKAGLMPTVLESFERVKQGADLVIVEGAGSPAEVNLRAGDIANMGFALAADVPVILTGDIDRGGVIAALVGSHIVLTKAERAQIKGFLINKFRGDVTLFDEGAKLIEAHTAWRNMGVIPWFNAAHKLPAEDALGLVSGSKNAGQTAQKTIKIDVLRCPHIANFDDLDPLRLEPNVCLRMVQAGAVLRRDADLVILPGSKATMADLAFIKAQGWDIDLKSHLRQGGKILGICGGYQMLGKMLADLEGIEGCAGQVEGLGLLDINTALTQTKRLEQVRARHEVSGLKTAAYRMHIGKTQGRDCIRPLFTIEGEAEGAQSENYQVMGSYLHGLFSDDGFRAAFLENLGLKVETSLHYSAEIEQTLDKLAQHLEQVIDAEQLLRL